jgi:hypothetical protein
MRQRGLRTRLLVGWQSATSRGLAVVFYRKRPRSSGSAAWGVGTGNSGMDGWMSARAREELSMVQWRGLGGGERCGKSQKGKCGKGPWETTALPE